MDGMQEVRGSNPLSSTKVTDKIRKSGHRVTAGKYSSGDRTRCRAGVRIRLHLPLVAAGKAGGWRLSGAVPLSADQDKCPLVKSCDHLEPMVVRAGLAPATILLVR